MRFGSPDGFQCRVYCYWRIIRRSFLAFHQLTIEFLPSDVLSVRDIDRALLGQHAGVDAKDHGEQDLPSHFPVWTGLRTVVDSHNVPEIKNECSRSRLSGRDLAIPAVSER